MAKFKMGKITNKYLIIEILGLALYNYKDLCDILFSSSKQLRNLLEENFSWIRRIFVVPLNCLDEGSKCKITKENLLFLERLVRKKDLTMLYRASHIGWMAEHFHQFCDSQPNTISLFQIKNGDCIGGYTSASWSSDGDFKKDDHAFLFNLNSLSHFPSHNSGLDIYCDADYGPCFSGGTTELNATPPFNGELNCRSLVYQHGYQITADNEVNQLTYLKDSKFTITELEVWLVLSN